MGEIEFTNTNVVSSFSGAFMSYDESTNTFGISSIFAPAMGIPAIAIDRFSNVGIKTNTPNEALTVVGNISATGSITAGNFIGNTAYTVSFVPFVSAGQNPNYTQNSNANITLWPASLSGVIPAVELSTRLLNNKGTIEGLFMFTQTASVSTKQCIIQIAKDSAFTTQTTDLYRRTAGETTAAIMRPVNGIFVNDGIVFPTANASTPAGTGGVQQHYAYAAGDSIYYRVGFAYPGYVGMPSTEREVMGLSAAYLKIVP